MHQRSGALPWRQVRDRNRLAAAKITLQALTNLRHGIIITEMRAQLAQAQPRRVQTASAIRAVIKMVVDIFEQRGFEFGIVHATTIAPVACGYLGYKSYRSSVRGLLYATGCGD
jgi:hypothetical protein